MVLQITANISGEASLMKKFGELAADSAFFKFDEALKKMGTELKGYYSDQAFTSQGGVFGVPWAQLAPSTQAYKLKHYTEYAAMPLIETDTMRKSFRATTTSRKLTIDNTAPYFVYHQSSEPRHKLPRRQMLGVNNDVKNIIGRVIRDDIKSKLAAL